jgi:transposase
MHYIGIDIGKKRVHAAWLRDPEQERSRPKAADNTPDGHRQLLAWAERHSQCTPAQLCFILEATGVYHEALALYLHQAGARVCVVNPYQVKEFARSRGIRTKNDRHDGHVLALFGRERRPPPWQPPPAEVRHLLSLLKRIEALEEDRQRERNRLEKATVEGAPAPVCESLRAMLATLEAEIARLRRQLDDHIDAHPELKQQRALLESIPGVGPKLSAWFLALFSAKRFRSAKQAAAFLGLIPVEYDSGSSVHRRPRLSKAGDGRWRARLYLPALVAIRWNSAIRTQFQRLIGAGKAKMSAVGAAMRKLVHIAFGVFNGQRPFHAPELCADAT